MFEDMSCRRQNLAADGGSDPAVSSSCPPSPRAFNSTSRTSQHNIPDSTSTSHNFVCLIQSTQAVFYSVILHSKPSKVSRRSSARLEPSSQLTAPSSHLQE
ncbi:hypothetical protein DL95DRAFT_16056 [Leptodontidium sp. 2 PMI_412]|nr:hypothetical protein DL95DRAFT_16056 [Leptodontidium sp. 2 PMI_412]